MSGPRTPPVELEAERGFLGAMLLEPSLLDSCVTALSPEDFHKESHRSIWATLRRLQSAGQGTDLIALRSELRRCGVFEAIGGETTLAILQEEGTVATQVPSYIALIREAACKRTLLQLGGALIDGAANGRPTRDLIPVIQDTLDRLGDGPTPPRAVDPLGMGSGRSSPRRSTRWRRSSRDSCTPTVGGGSGGKRSSARATTPSKRR
jgi:replicative DNA helicase